MSEAQSSALTNPVRDIGLVVVWALAFAIAIVWGGGFRVDERIQAEPEALVPLADRSRGDEPWLLVRLEAQPVLAEGEEDPSAAILQAAGFALEEALGPERVPLAPPRSEIGRWLDAHALYSLPVSAHEELRTKLADAAMLAEIQGLKARMASPLFAALPDQPRRDPLDLRRLAGGEVGRLGWVDANFEHAAQVTPSGDLLGHEGTLLLVQLRSDATLADLRSRIEVALADQPVEFTLLGPRARAEAADAQVREATPRLLIACFAALVLVMALVSRRLLPVLGVVLCLASVHGLLGWALGGFDLLGLAMVILLIGFACEAALDLQAIGLRGWASQLVLAGALLPLLASPYPAWQRWAWIWALGYAGAALILRVVLPALLRVVRRTKVVHDFEWNVPGFRLGGMPLVSLVVCLVLTGAGAWTARALEHRPPHLLPLALGEYQARELELRTWFFDPAMIVEAESLGPDPAAALDVAAGDAARLAEFVPLHARRLDSPGSFVLPAAELDARRSSLAGLALPERLAVLDALLADQGLRAEAFSEFVAGAKDIDDLPSAAAALEGPLGPWIARYTSEGGKRVRSRLELAGEASIPRAPDEGVFAGGPALHGPAIAGLSDRAHFEARLAAPILVGAWLIVLWVWLSTRSLGLALAVVLVSVAAQCGVLLALAMLDQPIGAHLLPALLLVGAATAVASGRSCRAVALDRPLVARGLLLAGLCQVVAGMILLSSSQPIWREMGLACAIGCMLGVGLGMFVAPGVARLFTGAARG